VSPTLLPIVAIVGRPNVGKSTLFNRILGKRTAIVDELPGLTRDRHYAEANWNGRNFLLVDTGGIDPSSAQPIQRQIVKQTDYAIDEADLTLLLVDFREGLTPLDLHVAERIRKHGRPAILVVNKLDTNRPESELADYYSLGLDDPIPMSALHGRGSGDLLDLIVGALPEAEAPPVDPNTIRIAVVGRPNVGKSSLVNRLLGAERMVVDATPGTTRDAVDTTFRHGAQTITLVDTAGMRREAKVHDPVEFYGITRALRAISRADLVLLVVDISREPAKQEARLAAMAEERTKAIVVVFNKWDLVEDPAQTRPAIEEEFTKMYPFLEHAPRLYVSAKTGAGVSRILPTSERVFREYVRQIPTPELNRAIQEILNRVVPPATPSGKHLKFYYAAQTSIKPPTFALYVNNPRYRIKNYVSYLERGLRERFGFQGIPIVLDWKRSQ
jgi:GTP-binding protein